MGRIMTLALCLLAGCAAIQPTTQVGWDDAVRRIETLGEVTALLAYDRVIQKEDVALQLELARIGRAMNVVAEQLARDEFPNTETWQTIVAVVDQWKEAAILEDHAIWIIAGLSLVEDYSSRVPYERTARMWMSLYLQTASATLLQRFQMGEV